MAYIVKRPNGSWEIRESRMTEKGPRSITLASFREDTPQMRSKVLRRTGPSLTESQLERMLDEAGVPPTMTDADRAARALLLELARGSRPSEPLRRSLLQALAGERPDVQGDHRQERDPAERDQTVDEAGPGRVLEDVLNLAELLPYEPKEEIHQRPLRDLVAA